MIKAVIFDVGGVLAQDIWEHLLFDVPNGIADTLQLDNELVYEVAKSLWEKYSYIPTQNASQCDQLEKECWQSFIEALKLSYSPDYFIKLTQQFVQPVPGMTTLLEELQDRHVDLLICSNNNEFFFNHQMTRLGLNRFFPRSDKIILSSRSGVSKTNPSLKMFRDVIATLECEPNQSLFVDDRDENIERALECNIPCVLFPAEASYGSRYLRTLLNQLMSLNF